jgi:hypothetical protein
MHMSIFDLPEAAQKQVLYGNLLPISPNGSPNFSFSTNLFAADRRFMGETFDLSSDTLKKDFPDRLEAEKFFTDRSTEAQDQSFIVSAYALPPQGHALPRYASALAYLRLAQTAIALERFRSVNDAHYPDSLSELAPNYLPVVPMDPFDGQPLRYHKRAAGYLLYSIGMDRKDDGGMRLKGGKGDLVFSVLNPSTAN